MSVDTMLIARLGLNARRTRMAIKCAYDDGLVIVYFRPHIMGEKNHHL